MFSLNYPLDGNTAQERHSMLLLRIASNSHQPGRSLISVFLADKDEKSPLLTFWAEGEIRREESAPRTFTYHRFILSPDFDVIDTQTFGRYGILEICNAPLFGTSPEDADGCLYISGGKQADANSALGSMVRLSQKDHRALVKLVRRYNKLKCELVIGDELFGIETHPVLIRSDSSSALNRLLRYAPTFPLAATPFLIPHMAEAQCASPSSGDYDSGTNYSGVDFDYVQTQESVETFAYVPTSNSGATIAGGLDLGQQSADSLTAMGVSSNLVEQFTPFYGLTGQAAQNAINNNTAAAGVTDAEATQIDDAVYNSYATAAATAFDNASPDMTFTDLNVQWQTVIMSMYFQGGAGITRTNFWNQVTNGQWAAAIANLENFGGPSTAQNNRAARNANYLNQTGCTNGTTN
jgi:Bacterial toxin homologue of phage lysozyme, C-term